jgi:hypothetical protein
MTTDIKKIIKEIRDREEKYSNLKRLTEFKGNTTEKSPISQDSKEGSGLDKWQNSQKGNMTEKTPIFQDGENQKDNKDNLKGNIKKTTSHGELP